jgi:APA family basic amino acid/polyamine antiporter
VSEDRSSLGRALGRTDVIALGFGTMVGWAWIVVITSWVTKAGFWGALIAYGGGIGIVLLIGLVYGELTAALPLSGGEMVFAYRAGGKTFGWVVGWMQILANTGVAAWEGIALASAMDRLLPLEHRVYLWDIAGEPVYLSWSLIGIVGAVFIMVLNLLGLRQTIIFQIVASFVVIAAGLMMALGGITYGGFENIEPGTLDLKDKLYVVMALPALMSGFGVIPRSAEEMNIGRREIGRMIVVCIILAAVWYLMIIIAVGVGAPPEVTGSGDLPVINVVIYIFGNDNFAVFFIVVGLLGIFTSWNGFFIGATRLLFAMGRAKMLPGIFGRPGRRFHTPWAATLLVGCICAVMPLLGSRVLEWMINISSACTMVSYCCVSYSMLALRIREPGLVRPFRVGKSKWPSLLIFLLTIIYLGSYIFYAISGGGYLPVAIVIAAWFAFGLLMQLVTKASHRNISDAEQEVLIFGERLARPQRKRGDAQ